MVPFAVSNETEIIEDFAKSEVLLGQEAFELMLAAPMLGGLGGWVRDGATPQKSASIMMMYRDMFWRSLQRVV
jgi:hypothetical protein